MSNLRKSLPAGLLAVLCLSVLFSMTALAAEETAEYVPAMYATFWALVPPLSLIHILIRYKNLKRIYAYKMDSYWSNIASVDSYYETNMDFLKPEVRNYFFKEYPDVYSKVDDLAPAKYNPGASVKNSLVSSGCIINGVVENSVLFKKVYVGNNCVIKNSVILNEVYIGDNTVIENCIVESRDTIPVSYTHLDVYKRQVRSSAWMP